MATWPRRHPLLPTEVPTYLPIPFILRSYRLFLCFYDVRAYLWSASSRGHGGGFLWSWDLQKATDLLEVLFDKVLKPLDAVGSALWKRKTSASNCPLWDGGGEVSRPRMRLETYLTNPTAWRSSWSVSSRWCNWGACSLCILTNDRLVCYERSW